MQCRKKPKKSIRLKNSPFQSLCGIEKAQPDLYTYSADFETSTPEWVEKDGCARVWAWKVKGLFVDFSAIGNDIHSFFICMFFMGRGTIYFANAKFDTAYLIDYALKAGIYNTYRLCEGTFFTSEFMGVTVLDSLKLLGGSIESQAKTWNLSTSKREETEYFYNTYRAPGHLLTMEEVEYISGDVDVQADALKAAFSFGLGVSGITKAGTAFSALKKYVDKQGFSFNKLFPKLESDDLERACYRGGWCLAAEKYAGKIVENVRCFDINAMYAAAYSGSLPSVDGCRYMDIFPCGNRYLEWHGECELPVRLMERGDLYFFARVYVKEACLRSGRLPTIQYKARYTEAGNSKYNQRDYLEVLEDVDLFLDKRDFYNIFLQDYLADYEIKELVFYRTERFENVFATWAQTWSAEKARTNKYKENGEKNPEYNPGARQIAKDMLTNPYGKFGMRAEKTIDIPRVSNGLIVFDHEKDPKDASVYVPFACAVTSAARSFITRVAQQKADTFAYADTDSVKLVGDELPAEIVSATKLGFFKDEGTYTRAKFLRAKTYMSESDGEIEYTVCGLPKDGKDILKSAPADEQFARFNTGLVVPGCKLIPKRVRGGVVLERTDFSIKRFGGFRFG